MNVDDALKKITTNIIELIGEDPQREGLKDTPRRVSKSWKTLTEGYHIDPTSVIKSALFQEKYPEQVLIKNIEFFSLCEHHLLPFFGTVHIAYIPNKHIVGLSKIPRVVNILSRRLQIQERLTQEIGEHIDKALLPRGVAVMIQAQHLCMMMRGVERKMTETQTLCFLGCYQEKENKEQFLQSIK